MIAAALLAALTSVAQAHLPVTTSSASAQQAFDQGLTRLYAFQPQAAEQSFAQALRDDPHLAMAAWGEALANGTDLNTHLTRNGFERAESFVRTAKSLESYASPQERAYIDAVALRYSGTWDERDTDETAYLAAMKRLTTAYPSDDNAAMLYTEALMVRYGEQNAESHAIIQAVLARDPQNIMANHLCVHAYDTAADHSPALPCAQRLDAMPFEPADEHLAHMPEHTYIEMGEYAKALASAERAWNLREAWNASSETFTLKYDLHDAYVAWSAALMMGDRGVAQTWESRFNASSGGSAPVWITQARFDDWPSPADLQKDLAGYGKFDSDERSILQAAVAERNEQYAAAEASLQRALQYQARNDEGEMIPLFPAGELLGQLYMRLGRYADARTAFQATLVRYPDDPRALYGLSQALGKLGQAVSAQQMLKRFRALWNGQALPAVASL